MNTKPSGPQKARSILIVDDEVDFLTTLEEIFVLEGWQVHTATGGFEAIERLSHIEVDLILTDVRMPQGSGVELVLSLQKNQNTTPVLVLSGYCETTEYRTLQYGAKAFLMKPIAPTVLIAKVEEILAATSPRKQSA